MNDPIHSDLPFCHGLQQAGLGFWGGSVDFIRQKHLVHDRACLIGELAAFHIINGESCHVAGQGIRCKLDPSKAAGHAFGKGQRQSGLPHARDILQKYMAPCKKGD